jgi:hypothetical protein
MNDITLADRLMKGFKDRIWDVIGLFIAVPIMIFAPYPFLWRLAICLVVAFIYFFIVRLSQIAWSHYRRSSNSN